MESLGRFWYYLKATQGPHCCMFNFRTTENSSRGRDIWREVRGGVGHLSGGHPSHPACPDQSWRWRQISTCLEDYLSFPPSPPVASDLFCAFRNEVQIHLIYSFRLNCSDQLDSIEVFGIQIRWSFAGGVLSLKHEGKCCDNFKAVF